MKAFRDLSIRRKQSLLVVGTSMVSLLLACTAFVSYDVATFRAEMVESLSSLAGVVGNNLTAAIDFGDEATARETLSALRDETNIDEARVYDVSGELFADYARTGEKWIHHPPEFQDTGHVYFNDHLYLFHPVTVQGETVGTVMLVSNLEELTDRLTRYGIIVVGVFLLATAIAYMLTVRLGRLIIGPIQDLASLMHSVAAQQDYSRRAPRTSGNEIGKLVDGFNEMLTQIQLRDGELRAARDDLENRVRERTQELQQAVAESAREKQRFQLIFESVPVGISLRQAAPGGGLSSFILNEAHRHITGLNAEESVVPANYAALTHPDDLARQRAVAQQLDEGRIDRFSLEKRYCRRDGTTVWVSFSVQRSRRPDGSFEDLSTVVDITDLKRAQEDAMREQARFKFIFDSVPVGFTWMVRGQPDSRIVNPAHATITGVPLEKCQEIELYRKATHPEDEARQQALHRRLDAGEIASYHLEKRYIHPDGSIRWVELTVRHFLDQHTGETQEITTAIDITDRKRAEEQLEATHKQLLQASRQAGMAEVATGVLHNVGNVLNSINVSATIVAESVRKLEVNNLARVGSLLRQHDGHLGTFFSTDPKAAQIPIFIEALAEHMATGQSTVIHELDNLRKNVEHIKDIVAMQQSYAKVCGVAEEIPVTELVEDALRMNAGALSRHEVDLIRDFQTEQAIEVEKHKVLQILVNLIRNAKYACDDSGRPDKQLIVRIEEAGANVRISVIDNGVGIPAANLTRIFSHGFTTRKNGHGFGLHSGALAAKEMGGFLTVASDGPGCGAAFALTLPVRAVGERAA